MKNILLTLFIIFLASSIYAQPNQTPPPDSNIFSPPKLILEAVAGDEPGQFSILTSERTNIYMPQDFVVDYKGNIWILDSYYKSEKGYGRVQKFDADGNYLLQFIPYSFVKGKLRGKYIKTGPGGNVVLGPLMKEEENHNNLIIINNKGEFIREIPIIIPEKGTIDYAVNSLGEIMYYSYLNSGLIVSDFMGNIKYTLKNKPFVKINAVSPYSDLIIYEGRSQFPYLSQYIKDINNKSAQSTGKEFELSEPDDPELKNPVVNNLLQYDKEGNMFFSTLLRIKPSVSKITYYNSDGKFLCVVPDCPKHSISNPTGPYEIRYKIDKYGNLYQMECAPAETCLRIWKWERIKK